MPLDVNVLAAEVALAIKSATGPLLERIATLEAKQSVLGDLRDRVVTVEAKAAQPVLSPAIELPPPVDLSPMLERMAAAEARIETLGDLRDRVVTVETKALQPPPVVPAIEPAQPVDLSPVFERLASAEARLGVLGDLRDRVVVVETKASLPAPEPPAVDLSPVLERVSALERQVDGKVDGRDFSTSIADIGKGIVDLRERVAAAEVRPLLSGPAGAPGQDGKDGANGKDGADGLGFDDLLVTQDDERTFTIKAARGERVKDIGTVKLPVEIYRGVFVDGKTYERGDGVTWGGSEWHANETTTNKPGDGSKAWTLKVKKGRDGKDGRDAATVPVVSVRR